MTALTVTTSMSRWRFGSENSLSESGYSVGAESLDEESCKTSLLRLPRRELLVLDQNNVSVMQIPVDEIAVRPDNRLINAVIAINRIALVAGVFMLISAFTGIFNEDTLDGCKKCWFKRGIAEVGLMAGSYIRACRRLLKVHFDFV